MTVNHWVRGSIPRRGAKDSKIPKFAWRFQMKFELWHDREDESYTLVQSLVEGASVEERNQYNFLTAGSQLEKEFFAKDGEEALEKRNLYLGW